MRRNILKEHEWELAHISSEESAAFGRLDGLSMISEYLGHRRRETVNGPEEGLDEISETTGVGMSLEASARAV